MQSTYRITLADCLAIRAAIVPAPNPSSMFTTATPGRATGDHRQQRAHAAEGRAVARAGRHRDHRRGHDPADDRGQRRIPPGHDHHAVRALEIRQRGLQPVQPGHARVPVHDHLGAEQLRPHLRLAHHRRVRRARRTRSSRAPWPRARRARSTPAAPARPRRRRRRSASTASRAALSARVTSTLPEPASSSAVAIALISSGVLPSATIASGAPWRASRLGVHAREAEVARRNPSGPAGYPGWYGWPHLRSRVLAHARGGLARWGENSLRRTIHGTAHDPEDAVMNNNFHELAHRRNDGIDVTMFWDSATDRVTVAVDGSQAGRAVRDRRRARRARPRRLSSPLRVPARCANSAAHPQPWSPTDMTSRRHRLDRPLPRRAGHAAARCGGAGALSRAGRRSSSTSSTRTAARSASGADRCPRRCSRGGSTASSRHE